MDITINPHGLSGTVQAVPSKSQAHRLMICAAFSDRDTDLLCPVINEDMEATADCLNSLGASIRRTQNGFEISPIKEVPASADLYCRESGSTLRFLLPICGALGVNTAFHMEGRLPHRPLSPLWEEMERMGCILTMDETLHCTGKLIPGDYHIAGNVSSQFISGLLFALALIPGESKLTVKGKLQSAPYVKMTRDALSLFSVDTERETIGGSYPFHSPGTLAVEGDWSSAAFFLAADFMGNSVSIEGLNENSSQGDSEISRILPALTRKVTISAADIPDLIPILSIAAAASQGAVFTHIARLRLKESNRVQSVQNMLGALGCKTEATEDTLTVFPGKFSSCTIDAANDHRIAMAAAIAATAAQGPVTILGAECVKKSYPCFWQDYKSLGGNYEQYIR